MIGWGAIVLGVGAAGVVAAGAQVRRATATAVALTVGRTFQLTLLAAGTFLMAFQGHTIGPMIPMLAAEFAVPTKVAGFLVPAYALPYSLAALVYGSLSDRVDRRRVIGFCIGALGLALLGTALAPSLGLLAASRVLAGSSAGGVVAVSLAYVADLYPYQERGRAIGVVFAAISAGLAGGFSAGPVLASWVGWRMVFLILATFAGALVGISLPTLAAGGTTAPTTTPDATYRAVLAQARARRVYYLMVAIGACTFGSAAWFGVYAHSRYGLRGLGIGLAYLAYGSVCGLSPLTGALADRIGRAWLVPAGFASVALGWGLVGAQGPLPLALLGLAAVALGHQLTYPLLAALVSEVVPTARGRAMGLNTFSLFIGISGGSLLIGSLLSRGFGLAFGGIALIAALAAIAAAGCLRGER